MRFVIFDDDTMEPITVVSVPGFGERNIEEMGRRLRLTFSVELLPMREGQRSFQRLPTVDLWFEQMLRKGQLSWICYTRQADLAMLLEPDWLPGQRDRINDYERDARAADRLIALILAHTR